MTEPYQPMFWSSGDTAHVSFTHPSDTLPRSHWTRADAWIDLAVPGIANITGSLTRETAGQMAEVLKTFAEHGRVQKAEDAE